MLTHLRDDIACIRERDPAARSTWEMRVLDGVDHHPWLRAPQECLQHIEQWLSRLSVQAPASPGGPRDRAAGLGVRVQP